MVIDNDWVINYIINNGTKIVIPKEVTCIKSGSFELRNIDEKFGEGFSDKVNFELFFEDESELREIESHAFFCLNISNVIHIPNSVEKIDNFAFYGNIYKFIIDEKSKLNYYGYNDVGMVSEIFTIPCNLKDMYISEYSKTNTVIVTDKAKVENIKLYKSNIKVVFPNGKEIISGDNKFIFEIQKRGASYLIFFKERNELYFEFLDANTLEKKKSGKLMNHDYRKLEPPIYRFESIFDVDENSIRDGERIFLNTDFISSLIVYCDMRKNGLTYTNQEIKEIKKILKSIISKVNVPPFEVKDREKIIYAQIVQNLFEYLVYDIEGAELIDKGDNCDKDEQEIADATQNMKGLLKGKTVCKGFSTVINSLALYFGIQSISVGNGEHAWNYLTLDGKKYEDDFTWYRDYLAVSNIMGIYTFLRGKDLNGKREFDNFKCHSISEKLDLDEGITATQQLNLLATDWSKIDDWSKVDLNSSKICNSMMEQLFKFASNHQILSDLLLKNKIINNYVNNQIIENGRGIGR